MEISKCVFPSLWLLIDPLLFPKNYWVIFVLWYISIMTKGIVEVEKQKLIIIGKNHNKNIYQRSHWKISFFNVLNKEKHFADKRKWSCSVVSDSLRPHGQQPTRLLCPWDFPGKSTGVSCCFLLPRIFPPQGSKPGLSHCRQTFYRLSHQGSQNKYARISMLNIFYCFS